MGIFSGAGSIIGGIAGRDAEAPDILDEFKPRQIFKGLSAGGFNFRIGEGGRFVATRGKSAQKNLRQLEKVFKQAGGVRRGFQNERRRLGDVRRDLKGLRGEAKPRFAELTGDLRSLRAELRPGFGRLTQARVKAIERAEEKASGNLRGQFSARRVLGSSFAAREAAGLTAEFGEREEEARAQAQLEELEATFQIDEQLARRLNEEIGARLGINQELRALSGAQAMLLAGRLKAIDTRLATVQTKIKADLATAGLAANIQANIIDIAARIAQAQAGLEAQAAADRGAGFAGIFSGLDEVAGGLTGFGSLGGGQAAGEAAGIFDPTGLS